MRALGIEVRTYGSVRSILDKNLDAQAYKRPPRLRGDPPSQHPGTAVLPLRGIMLTHPTLHKLNASSLFGMERRNNRFRLAE